MNRVCHDTKGFTDSGEIQWFNHWTTDEKILVMSKTDSITEPPNARGENLTYGHAICRIIDKTLVCKKGLKDWNTDRLNASGEICWYIHWSDEWQMIESWTWGKGFTDPLTISHGRKRSASLTTALLNEAWASLGHEWKDSLSPILIYWKIKTNLSQQ